MEIDNDVQLIQNILAGDTTAFRTLVEKHQKSVHALIWRKIGDFHHAEEITQDTFLRVYKGLPTLKNPNQFAGWLYVIANRLCIDWIRKQKDSLQLLEDTPVAEINKSSYSRYVLEEREQASSENRRDFVKQLLAKLPESERTVVTLYYLGEMTTKEIGKFLGVSVHTITSRLQRGRKRLQDLQEELIVSDILGSIPFPGHITDQIMQQVEDIGPPIQPPVTKPFLPWLAFGTAMIVVVVMLGVGNQYLARFQRPYSFDAQSEPKIEIVDAPIVLDIISNPSTRRQFGQTTVPSNNAGAGTQLSETTLRSMGQEDAFNLSTAQWTQTSGPPGGHVHDIFATSQGSVYAISRTGMYKLEANTTAWTRLNASIPIVDDLMPMVENRGTLYIVSTNEIFASTDNGQTWSAFCTRPKGSAIGLIFADATQEGNRQSDMTMYLALRDEGIFRSTDSGTRWESLDEGLVGDRMTAVAAIGNTVFAGTTQGLYRLDSGTWTLLPIGASETVYSLAVSENNLYVGIGPYLLERYVPGQIEETIDKINRMALNKELSESKIFHSHDLGTSWTDITPKNGFPYPLESGIQLLTAGKTLLALAQDQFRSTDGGKNWTRLGSDTDATLLNNIPSVAINEETFYKVGAFGIHRTTDAGESWDLFMNGVMGTRIVDLIAFNDRLYAYNGINVFQSIDGGASWKSINTPKDPFEWSKPLYAGPRLDYGSRLLVADNILYFLSLSPDLLHISSLSTDSNVLIPIQDAPALESEPEPRGLIPYSDEERQVFESYAIENSIKSDTLAISGNVFYLEFRRTLYKWRLGDPTWANTGLVDTPHASDADKRIGFKLAVSGERIYVGKRDGKLFQSLDEGDNWKDLTPNLPFRFTRFKEIVFVGSRVYVATDKGVLVSQNGEHWQTVTDTTNNHIVINHFAVDGHTLYGIDDIGIYRLNNSGQWEQISSEIPDEVTSLTILNNRLYGVTENHGIFHMLLESVY